MSMLVRKVNLDELSVLMEWRMRVLREVFPVNGEEDRSVICAKNEDYYKKHLSDGSHTACFAVDDDSGEIVGCGGICYQDEMPSPDNPEGKNGYLMNIYTLPQFRGKGIGRKIIEFLIAEAKAKGTGKIYLESSRIAKPLYQELGFTDMPDYMKLI